MIEKICPFCEKVFDEELIKDHIGIEHLGLETGALEQMYPKIMFLIARSVTRNSQVNLT